jgi:hypothetical protein
MVSSFLTTALPAVWIYTQSNITSIIFTWVHYTNTEKIQMLSSAIQFIDQWPRHDATHDVIHIFSTTQKQEVLIRYHEKSLLVHLLTLMKCASKIVPKPTRKYTTFPEAIFYTFQSSLYMYTLATFPCPPNIHFASSISLL